MKGPNWTGQDSTDKNNTGQDSREHCEDNIIRDRVKPKMDRCSVSDGYQSDDKSSDEMNSEKISQQVIIPCWKYVARPIIISSG